MQILLLPILLAQPALRPGWPIPILHESEYGYWGGPKAYDVDFDGEKEILFAAGTAESGGILYAFNLDGTFPPGWPVQVGEPPLFCEQSPVVGDLDGDYIPEIAVGTFSMSGETGGIHAFELNGTPVQNFPIPAPPNLDVMFPLSLALITPDSVPDILVAFHHSSGSAVEDLFGVMNPLTGDFLTGWPVSREEWFGSRPVYWPYGNISIYINPSTIYDSGSIGTWDIYGTLLPGWPMDIPGIPGLCMPAVADLNLDGQFELIAPWKGPIGQVEAPLLYVFDQNGGVLPGFPIEFEGFDLHGPPSLADFDQDGIVDVILDAFSTILIVHFDGSYDTLHTGIAQFGGEPAVADIDGDDNLEIIMGRSDLIEHDSSLVNAFRLDGSQPLGWPICVQGIPRGTPLIEDLDEDGFLELVVFTKSDPWSHPDTGWLYLFDLPAPFDSAMVPWGQYAHDLWNSGIYGFNPPVSVAERGPLKIPSTYQVVYRNGIPFLTFTLTQPQKFYIDLYDVSGRRVWKKFLQLPQGSHTIPLSPNTSPGIYILNLKSTINKTIKVIKLR